MDTPEDAQATSEEFTLPVDHRGRVTLPKCILDRLGIEPGDEVSARLDGSVLTIDPTPSHRPEPAAARREHWTETTPMDAGEALFGRR